MYDPDTLPRMPAWVTSARAETLEDVAFVSGMALSHLHVVLGWSDVPHALLPARLALRAAEACSRILGVLSGQGSYAMRCPPKCRQDPRSFVLGRFSNAGRSPAKTSPSCCDPHQKTFTIREWTEVLVWCRPAMGQGIGDAVYKYILLTASMLPTRGTPQSRGIGTRGNRGTLRT
jgi:hypothetical protein